MTLIFAMWPSAGFHERPVHVVLTPCEHLRGIPLPMMKL
jgi:hypothetical protein